MYKYHSGNPNQQTSNLEVCTKYLKAAVEVKLFYLYSWAEWLS